MSWFEQSVLYTDSFHFKASDYKIYISILKCRPSIASCMDPMFIYSVYLFVGRRVLHTEDDLKIFGPPIWYAKAVFRKAWHTALNLNSVRRKKWRISHISRKKIISSALFSLQFSKCILAKKCEISHFSQKFSFDGNPNCKQSSKFVSIYSFPFFLVFATNSDFCIPMFSFEIQCRHLLTWDISMYEFC